MVICGRENVGQSEAIEPAPKRNRKSKAVHDGAPLGYEQFNQIFRPDFVNDR